MTYIEQTQRSPAETYRDITNLFFDPRQIEGTIYTVLPGNTTVATMQPHETGYLYQAAFKRHPHFPPFQEGKVGLRTWTGRTGTNWDLTAQLNATSPWSDERPDLQLITSVAGLLIDETPLPSRRSQVFFDLRVDRRVYQPILEFDPSLNKLIIRKDQTETAIDLSKPDELEEYLGRQSVGPRNTHIGKIEADDKRVGVQFVGDLWPQGLDIVVPTQLVLRPEKLGIQRI